MTGHSNWFMEYIWHPMFQDSSEAKGAKCCKCTCGLPPNNWCFASNEKLEPRYDDDVVCFFKEHKEKIECTGITLSYTYPKEVSITVSLGKTRAYRVLSYMRVGGRAKPYQKGYYCLSCFVQADFREKSDGPDWVKNEALTLCTTYEIGAFEPPKLT